VIVRLIRFGEALFSLEIMAMSGRVGRQMERRTEIQFLFGWIAERYRTQSHSAFFSSTDMTHLPPAGKRLPTARKEKMTCSTASTLARTVACSYSPASSWAH